MMGDSLNLSALVVVLSLTLWYALWGGVGAFLSAPLTVIVMIVFAQFSTTRWLAVLLSADGMPSTGKKI
jgi:predicted PurR-regulated permease PerM